MLKRSGESLPGPLDGIFRFLYCALYEQADEIHGGLQRLELVSIGVNVKVMQWRGEPIADKDGVVAAVQDHERVSGDELRVVGGRLLHGPEDADVEREHGKG